MAHPHDIPRTAHPPGDPPTGQVPPPAVAGRVRGLAHDLDNLLCIVRGHLDLVGLDLPPDHHAWHNLAAIQAATERIEGITDQLRALGNTMQAGTVGRGMVLVVDPDPATRLGHREILSTLGREVREAGSATEALAVAATPGTVIRVLVTPLALPDGDGVSLASRLAAAHPGLQALVSVPAGAEDDLPAPCRPLVTPFTRAFLARRVRGVLDGG